MARTRTFVVAVLFLAFALVASADFWDRPGCTGDSQDTCGALSGGTPAQDNEKECDHCITCIVAHGHFLSVVPAAGLVPPTPASIPSRQPHRIGTFEPLPAEIFHPPLAAIC